MGCKNSTPMVAPDSPRPPELAGAKLDGRSRSHEAAAPLENHGSVMEVVSSHATMEYNFAKHYRIIRHVGGTVSQIYMVVKNQNQCPSRSTAAASVQLKHQSPASVDASYNDGALYGEDLNVYVMQVIDMKSIAPERRESMRDEIKSLKRIEHANILRVCDVYDNIEMNNTIQMVTELCTGQDLASYAATPVSEMKARPIVIQILVAVNYMHKRGVFHHNLSLENIMFKDDSSGMIKITYAGLASRSAALNSVSHYLSGPRNRGDRDIYSIGSIAYQLLSGGREPPTSVDVHSDDDVVASNKRTNLFLSPIWKRILITKEAKSFIESALQHGFLTVLQALQHRWITQEPVYLQGTGASPLSDAKGNGYLVPTNSQNMEMLIDPNREGMDAKENLLPLCGAAEPVTGSVLPLSYDKNVLVDGDIDQVQEINSDDSFLSRDESNLPLQSSRDSDRDEFGIVDPYTAELEASCLDPQTDAAENACVSGSSSHAESMSEGAPPIVEDTLEREETSDDPTTPTATVEPETESLDLQTDGTENVRESETSSGKETRSEDAPMRQSADFTLGETSGTDEANDGGDDCTLAPVVEPETVSLDTRVDIFENVRESETSPGEETISEDAPLRQSAETFGTDEANDGGGDSTLAPVVELETVSLDVRVDIVEQGTEVEAASEEQATSAIAIVSPRQSADLTVGETPDTEESHDLDQNSSLIAVVESETVSLGSQADIVEKVIELDSSSDEESVVIAPPEQSAVSNVGKAPDSAETHNVDGSESSDDASVAVAMAPDQAPAETVPLDLPPLPPADLITASPVTPARLRKSFVLSEPGSPSSPRQTPADFRDLRDILRQASIAEGAVTMEELREQLRMLTVNKYTEEEVNSWFSGLNFDDSRNLSYKAVLAKAIRSRRKVERLRAEEAFRTIDKGKQGFVTVGNLRAVLGASNTEYIEKLMKEADTKHDGRIAYEKFKEVLERSNRTGI